MLSSELKKRALVMGISEYKYLPTLEFCRRDAEFVIKTLGNVGFDIPENRKFVGKLERGMMRDAIIDFFTDKNLKPRDTLLFYFSGYGVVDEEGGGYFATTKIDPAKPYREGISFEELTEMIDRSYSKRIVTILDCCYSGKGKVTGKGSKDKESNETKLGSTAVGNKFKHGEGKYLLAASLGSQEAEATKKGDLSVFTHYLLEGLRGVNTESTDKDGNVTPFTLGNYVSDTIMRLPVKKRPTQRPIMNILDTGNITLASYVKKLQKT